LQRKRNAIYTVPQTVLQKSKAGKDLAKLFLKRIFAKFKKMAKLLVFLYAKNDKKAAFYGC